MSNEYPFFSTKSQSKLRSSGVLIIRNPQGLHTRPAAELVKCASEFRSHIYLTYNNYVVNAKSLLGILLLAAEKGARIRIEAVGEDSAEAVSALKALAVKEFHAQC